MLLESDFNYQHSITLNIFSLGKGFELFGVQVWAVNKLWEKFSVPGYKKNDTSLGTHFITSRMYLEHIHNICVFQGTPTMEFIQ